MSKYWTELTHRLTPYVPGEQRTGDSVVKLNTNENPYPPPASVLNAIAGTSPDALRRYPDPESAELRQTLADYQHVTPDQVFTGNGSDEILALAFMAFFKGKAPLQFPEISYSFYPVYCDLLNITADKIPLSPDFTIPLDTYGGKDCGGIIFPNPNAPTAMAVTRDAIERLLQANPNIVVLVDEAYADFGAESAISLVSQYPNLVVSQTFSKGRSLAGLRLGVAYADTQLIEGLVRVKDSFNSYPVDAVAQAAGIASIKDDKYYRETTKKIIATREKTINELRKRHYRVLESAANFIFASPPDNNASDIHTGLDQKNILIRYWNKPVIKDWLRISIGTDKDMQQFFTALDAL